MELLLILTITLQSLTARELQALVQSQQEVLQSTIKGHSTYIAPHLEGGWINLVQLVKVAVDDGVLRESVLFPGGNKDVLGRLLPCGGLVVHLCGGQAVLHQEAIHCSLRLARLDHGLSRKHTHTHIVSSNLIKK